MQITKLESFALKKSHHTQQSQGQAMSLRLPVCAGGNKINKRTNAWTQMHCQTKAVTHTLSLSLFIAYITKQVVCHCITNIMPCSYCINTS